MDMETLEVTLTFPDGDRKVLKFGTKLLESPLSIGNIGKMVSTSIDIKVNGQMARGPYVFKARKGREKREEEVEDDSVLTLKTKEEDE